MLNISGRIRPRSRAALLQLFISTAAARGETPTRHCHRQPKPSPTDTLGEVQAQSPIEPQGQPQCDPT